MIPWLLVAELISVQGKSLSQLVGERMAAYPCSGEVNYTVNDAKAVIAAVQAHYAAQQPQLDTTDGISLEFSDWRMSLRASNTEPLLRLNIESRANPAKVASELACIEQIIATAGTAP
jgi:phosphomannomutase/phosphomannomutase/phosphoglucomutase